MAENDNDVETVKVVDTPIKTKIAVDKPADAPQSVGDTTDGGKGESTEGGNPPQNNGDKIIIKDGKEYIETTAPDGTVVLQERGFWDKLRARVGGANQEGLNKAQEKIRIKLNKFGMIIAEAEQWVYEKYKLNQLMKDEEVEAEKNEIIEDVNIVLETRIRLVSAYGDIINVVMDIVSHVVTRALRFYKRKNGKTPDGSPGNEWSGDLTELEASAKQLGVSVDEYKKLAGIK